VRMSSLLRDGDRPPRRRPATPPAAQPVACSTPTAPPTPATPSSHTRSSILALAQTAASLRTDRVRAPPRAARALSVAMVGCAEFVRLVQPAMGIGFCRHEHDTWKAAPAPVRPAVARRETPSIRRVYWSTGPPARPAYNRRPSFAHGRGGHSRTMRSSPTASSGRACRPTARRC
jgi:hypothetical protein